MKKTEEDVDAEANEQNLQYHFDTNTFVTFSGEGNRLDGKKKKLDQADPSASARVSYNLKTMGFLMSNYSDFISTALCSWNPRL